MFLDSPSTTEEVRLCCGDLRVLNKSDFKMLLKWRLELLKEKKEQIHAMRHSDSSIPENPENPEDPENHANPENPEKKVETKETVETEKSVENELQEVRERLAVGMMGESNW